MRKRLFNQKPEPGARVAQKPQRLSVKAKIMMALFALMLIPQVTWAQGTGDYPITFKHYVAGYIQSIAINSTNEGDVLNDGKVKFIYNSSKNTGRLILTAATFDGWIESQLDALTIEFSGENIFAKKDDSGNIDVSGSGHFGYIRNTKTSGSATLTVKALSSNSSIYIMNEYGDEVVGNFSSITLEDAYAANYTPFYFNSTNKRYEWSDGTALQSITFTSTPTYPIWLGSSGSSGCSQAKDNGTSVSFSNTTVTSGTATFDSYTNTLELNGATVCDIWSGLDNLTINLKGANTLKHDNYGGPDSPIFSINGGTLTLETTDGTGSLTFDETNGTYTNPVGGFSSVTYDDGLKLGKNNSNQDEIKVNYEEYDLWILGTQVTSVNKNKINGSSLITYDPDTYTLTLKDGAYFWVNADPAIKSGLANLTVNIEASAEIYPNGSSYKYAFEGTVAGATITFTSSAASPNFKVKVQSSDYFRNITPVYNNGLCLFDKYNSGSFGVDGSIKLPAWTGSGTDSAPYLIKTYDDLKALSDFVNGDFRNDNMFFKLDQDIVCSGAAAVFNSIGYRHASGWNGTYFFNGTFDGNNHTISNLSSTYGLFGILAGTVKNLKLVNCTVIGGTSNPYQQDAAALAANSYGTIENCTVSGGSVSNGSNGDVFTVGGIAGYFHNDGTISNCVVENVTLTVDGALTYTGSCGGIAGQVYDGAISGCSVKNTQISASTTGSNPLYAGAIAGWRERGLSLSNNTYDDQVTVRTQVGTDPALTKSGNDQRGIGDADNNGNYDVFDNGAVLAGVKKLTLSVNTDGGSATVSGYYRAVGSDYYSLPTCSLTVKGTPNADYDIPALTLTDPSTNTDYTPGIPSGGADTESLSWSFPMPSVDLSGQMDFKIRLNKLGRVFTIDDFTYNGSGQGVTQIKTKKTSTSTNEITLSLTNGDVSFVDYMNSNGETLASSYNQANPPSAAGDYKISITAGNKTTGSCTVDYSINKASLADASIADIDDQTYTGSAITPEPTVTFNGAVLTKGTDFNYNYSNNTDVADKNGSSAPKVTIVGLGGNFLTTATNSKTFTIAQADLSTTTSLSIAAVTAQTYTGSEIKPTPAVTFNGNPLTAGTDFDFSYANNTNAALSTATTAPTVIVTGKNNFKGTSSKTFTIDQADFSTPSVVTIAAVTGQTYTGSEITPTPTVTFGSTQLVPGTDFDYDYANNTNAALSTDTPAPTVSIIGKGNFTGTNNVKFTIGKASLENASIADIDEQTYTGSAITPQPTVTFNGNNLIAGTDFRYDYSNNTDVADKNDSSAPKVTIVGLGGNFLTSPTKDKTFTIAQADFTTTTSLSIAAVTSQTYTGSEITPTPTVTFNGNPLTAGTDFDFSYANNTNAALSTATTAPTVIVTGKNNFKGTSSKTFTIDQADFSTPSVVTIAAVTGQTYTGSEITPTPTVTFGSTQLVPGTDFDYGYANNTNAALSTVTPAPTVTVIGKNNFKGTSSITFTIDQADLSTSTDVVVAAIDDQVYTGVAITPQPTVTFNGNPLTAGTDFTYGYTNNVNAADKSDSPAPTVTIIGNGNFKNNKPVTFTILDRTATIAFNPGRTYMTFYDANETFLVPNNVTAYIVTSVSGNTVTTKQVSYIPASTPVLLESTSGTTNVKNAGDSFAGNMLSYAAAAVSTNGNQYVLYSDEFVKATGTIPAGKVYLTFSSPVRRLTIDRNNSATAIEAIVEEAADGEQWYDMQGRKINKPTKDGLYIKNGKKVVVNNK